ncbi:AraC family transcriptional regulator [Prosthecomicrobium hirschii]|uniref:AraC family transcriptional regulator n=2 Tax=Prosthecodimorpha hirschii TaxID=665126 RepID=A0A0P6VXC8_9HYPH|nr:AraC family transcriptional regulator [Prosthecomicrobium hirschii]
MMSIMNISRTPSENKIMSPKVLITGASSGIGATYADRFARRGHDLVLVARDGARMEVLAARLRAETGVAIDILPADLTHEADVARVAARLRDDSGIGILVNNAGAALSGGIADQTGAAIARLIALNTTSLALLAQAAGARFAAEGRGSIINIASVVGLIPEFAATIYGSTKAFAIFLSQGLAFELGPKGVYVQAVLPAATRTEIWERAGADPATLPPMMDVNDLVDAALAGFDAREPITIPALTDAALWDAYQAARQAMLPSFGNTEPAARYRG